eukprot:COSAG02_NODE_15649_length_1151_cov_8.754753_1_plen_71_part_01
MSVFVGHLISSRRLGKGLDITSVLRESAESEWCSEKVRNLVPVRGGGKSSDPEQSKCVDYEWGKSFVVIFR